MADVIPLPARAPQCATEAQLTARFGITNAELHAAMKPLFLLMHDRGIDSVRIDRSGTHAVVTIDGETI